MHIQVIIVDGLIEYHQYERFNGDYVVCRDIRDSSEWNHPLFF